MADDYSKLVAIKRYIRRKLSAAEIKILADKAFADVQAGIKVTSTGFEGGNVSGIDICDPSLILQACEDVLVDLGETGAVAAGSRVVFSDYSGGFIGT